MYRKLSKNVILGHIKEDLIENIWTNFAKGRDLFKLHKIDEISTIDGVNIMRPFHRIEKQSSKSRKKRNFSTSMPRRNLFRPRNLRHKFSDFRKFHFAQKTSTRWIFKNPLPKSFGSGEFSNPSSPMARASRSNARHAGEHFICANRRPAY